MNKVVVITGASSGIGKSCAALFRDRGDIVLNISRTEEVGFGEFSYACDVTNIEQLAEVFKQIKKKYKKIDVLINNAGHALNGALELVTHEEFKHIIDVNIIAVHSTLKYALPLMGKGGKIINVASIQSIWAVPFRAPYSLTKAAVLSLSYALRLELKQAGIDVCAICPAETKTNFSKNRIKNLATNEKYGDQIENALNKIATHESKRMDPIIVAKQIVKQSYKRKSAAMKIVGKKFNFAYNVLKFMPINFQLYVINKFIKK